MDEGIRLLKLLANHPATMNHVSRKLCERFVNDDPPDGCVDDAVAAWKRSSGDIREVLRAIFHGPDFWAAENVRRSEEHTSELQSQSNLVCRLLLEKKKNKSK